MLMRFTKQQLVLAPLERLETPRGSLENWIPFAYTTVEVPDHQRSGSSLSPRTDVFLSSTGTISCFCPAQQPILSYLFPSPQTLHVGVRTTSRTLIHGLESIGLLSRAKCRVRSNSSLVRASFSTFSNRRHPGLRPPVWGSRQYALASWLVGPHVVNCSASQLALTLCSLTYRQQKLKCDEAKPTCGQYTKSDRECIFSQDTKFRHFDVQYLLRQGQEKTLAGRAVTKGLFANNHIKIDIPSDHKYTLASTL